MCSAKLAHWRGIRLLGSIRDAVEDTLVFLDLVPFSQPIPMGGWDLSFLMGPNKMLHTHHGPRIVPLPSIARHA